LLALWRVVTEASEFGSDFRGETHRMRLFEKRELFGEMTVQDNLLLGALRS
jgi:ABC-type branched-subunit amino acid transport system ATPase component